MSLLGSGDNAVVSHTETFLLQMNDLAPDEREPKITSLLGDITLVHVREERDFDEGYRLLDAHFGPVNEIERKEILTIWLKRGSLSPEDAPIRAIYHMVLARDRDGRTVAVRDAFSAIDLRKQRVVSLMSHSLVLEGHRRTGLGALLRAIPVALARRDAQREGLTGAEILLVAEMELVEPDRADTFVRLAAYRKGGFRVIPPKHLPYAQPDFRDIEGLGIEPLPIPFLLLVRHVDFEQSETLTAERAVAIIDALEAIHGPSLVAGQLEIIRAHTLQTLDAAGPPLPLLPLPRNADDLERIAPLSLEHNRHLWPERWHAPTPSKETL